MTSQPSAKISRRSVLAAAPAAALATLATAARSHAAAEGDNHRRPKIAALITEFRRNSHAEVIVDRILEGFGWEGAHYRPKLDLVAMYVDQFPESDLSRERAARFKDLKIHPTIAAALCTGGDKLAVDGVLIIGEHGNYKNNEKGQTLYPRFEFFQQTVEVFRDSGRSVPVFNDKHLSWNWEWAKQMVDTAAQMGFPLWAASSVPISWRVPAVDMPLGAEVEEVMSLADGSVDSYDFHALEMIQALVERRQGAERGVTEMQALRGDAFWRALEAGSWDAGGWDPRLLEACLCRSHNLVPAKAGFNHVYPTVADLRRLIPNPVAYRFRYADGLKASMLLLPALIGDITFAARLKGQDEPLSALVILGGGADGGQPHNFDALVWYIEQFMHTGKLPHPIERTLLTTGLVAAGVESISRGGETIQTPHLAIRYAPNHNSTFRQG
ncbi:MAG: hypothetical protein WDZ48_10625 [Pirellulales bacterium]